MDHAIAKEDINMNGLSRWRYAGWYSPYSTVLRAEQQLFPSKLSYAQARASILITCVNLYKAMGGGWISEAEQLTVQQNDDNDVNKKI
jgi:outer membrane protein TolC